MKKIIIASALCLGLFATNLQAQKKELHSPGEIIQIMDKSELAYAIRFFEDKIVPKDFSKKLTGNSVYRVRQKNGFKVEKYKTSSEVKAAIDKAEDFFQKKQYEDAREGYLKVLSLDSLQYSMYAYIGQTYKLEGKLPLAKQYYLQATAINPIDYLGHWFLADAYEADKQIDLAQKEILIAHILNRNNPRIMEALKRILGKNKKEYQEWQFNPQYTLEKKNDSTIDIGVNLLWSGYAMTKAVWKYEPGYKQSMGYEVDNEFAESEGKEALVSLVAMNEKSKDKELSADILAARQAFDKHQVQPFIYYEIYLPEHPSLAFQLPDELIENMSKYILEVRCK
jgi:tetratricopeptide (TPR) repeat protein